MPDFIIARHVSCWDSRGGRAADKEKCAVYNLFTSACCMTLTGREKPIDSSASSAETVHADEGCEGGQSLSQKTLVRELLDD